MEEESEKGKISPPHAYSPYIHRYLALDELLCMSLHWKKGDFIPDDSPVTFYANVLMTDLEERVAQMHFRYHLDI